MQINQDKEPSTYEVQSTWEYKKEKKKGGGGGRGEIFAPV